ncbi:unnamed protein product [Nezara viridula]|uniref:ZZ-type domain-containing protein n=1 Tax=Nezara viridula TaxID=85310 RepID=A0A9P0E804_NEZVI|nr:unnamed protein product [Nezara viridula]
MNRQIIHYKIIFTGPENETEIRYLAMETISYHNYIYFVRKLIAVFPVLKDLPFSVNWKDKEGDIVRICSDDELTIALDEMKCDPVKKIIIIVKQQGNDTMLHPDIACDSCDHPLKGFRYKCLVCADYELCSDCERSQTHSDHPMIRIPKPLTPDTPFGKQFTKDIPKISQQLEQLFQTGDEVSRSSNLKSSTDCKRRYKFCHNDFHNVLANLLVEKLIRHNIETSTTQPKSQQETHSSQPESSSSVYTQVRNEPQNVDVLMSGLRSLSIDVNSGGTKREGLTEQDESVHSTSGGHRLVTSSSPFTANMFLTTTVQAATSSELPVGSNPLNPFISQIDAAPIPADPTPVLQAQLTPPVSAILMPTASTSIPVSTSSIALNNTVAPPSAPTAITPVPLPRLIASAPAEDSMNNTSLDHSTNIPVCLTTPPIEEDGSLDNSWSVVGNEQTDISVTSSDSIDIIESFEASPASTSQPTDSSPTQKLGPYEESIMMLHTLGFEKKEWLNLVVEAKEGDIREVLRFLSPVKKLSTNLHK